VHGGPQVVSDEEVLETLMIVARKDAKDLNATTIAGTYARVHRPTNSRKRDRSR